MGLVKNIKRAATNYAIGGVAVLLGIDTFENGKNTLAITPDATPDTDPSEATVALATGITVKPVLIEFEDGGDNVCSFSDNAVIGGNTYLTHQVGFKIGGRSNSLNAILRAFDLGKTSFILKLKTGQCVVVGGRNGLKATQSNSGGDGTVGGFAGYDVVLAGAETERATAITQASFDAMLALIPA